MKGTFSRYSAIVLLVASKGKGGTSEKSAQALIKNLISVFGTHYIALSDKGARFVGWDFHDFAQSATSLYRQLCAGSIKV